MDLIVNSKPPASLADTGHIRLFGGVAELSTANLRMIIQNICRSVDRPTRHNPLWSLLVNIFGIGSQSAENLCRALNLDPDAKVKDVQW